MATNSTRRTAPAKDEATGEETRFEYEGEEYTIPPTRKWSVDAIEAVEDEKIATLCRAILGREQWARFKSTPRDAGDLDDFVSALLKAAGISGN